MSEKRECPHCRGSLERYEDPVAVKLLDAAEDKLDKLRSENARLSAVCMLGYSTFKWLLPHCDVGKDKMQVALIELAKAGDSAALRDLLAPTIELINSAELLAGHGETDTLVGFMLTKGSAELGRLRSITEKGTK